jgi:hypothetical protein
MLEHDPDRNGEEIISPFRTGTKKKSLLRSMVGTGFPKRSCSNNKLERDGDPSSTYRALGYDCFEIGQNFGDEALHRSSIETLLPLGS